jgi:pimeloyl-ACP methyl ester carboxylesterase
VVSAATVSGFAGKPRAKRSGPLGVPHNRGVTEGLRVQSGGDGAPVLLLLHGLGATGDVWAGWFDRLARRWPGRWVVPDLPGHGGSAPLPAYTFDGVAERIAAIMEPDAPTVVLGHSYGGVVGLALADPEVGLDVRSVVGLGIKVMWSADELARADALAQRPPGWFETRDDAAARYLRIAGLAGLFDAGSPVIDAGLRQEDGRWRLAMDPRTFGVGAPDMEALIARSTAEVVLARGERDPMNDNDQYRALGVPTVAVPGVGHNAHVEDPDAVYAILG